MSLIPVVPILPGVHHGDRHGGQGNDGQEGDGDHDSPPTLFRLGRFRFTRGCFQLALGDHGIEGTGCWPAFVGTLDPAVRTMARPASTVRARAAPVGPAPPPVPPPEGIT